MSIRKEYNNRGSAPLVHQPVTLGDWNASLKKYDWVGMILAFESGELSAKETIELFQHLIDTGKAWELQGFYGRTAQAMIKEGYCHAV